MLGRHFDFCVGTGWYNCEVRIYRFDMSTELNIVNAAIVETDDSRMRRMPTESRFSEEQQLEMKAEAESSWATYGYIVFSDTTSGDLDGVRIKGKSERTVAKGLKSRLKVTRYIPKCCIL